MEKILNQILSELQDIKQDVKGIKSDVNGLKEDVSILKEDVSELKEDVSILKEDVNGLKEDVSVLKEDVNGLKEDVSELKQGQIRIEKKLDVVFDQTTNLIEFETSVNDGLNTLKNSIDFMAHKEFENEKEMFYIKKHIQIIK